MCMQKAKRESRKQTCSGHIGLRMVLFWRRSLELWRTCMDKALSNMSLIVPGSGLSSNRWLKSWVVSQQDFREVHHITTLYPTPYLLRTGKEMGSKHWICTCWGKKKKKKKKTKTQEKNRTRTTHVFHAAI